MVRTCSYHIILWNHQKYKHQMKTTLSYFNFCAMQCSNVGYLIDLFNHNFSFRQSNMCSISFKLVKVGLSYLSHSIKVRART